MLPMFSNSAIKTAIKSQASAYSVKMGGINYTDNYESGDFEDSLNISTRRFPYLSTRDVRYKTSYTGVSNIYAWNELVRIVGTKVYYGAREISGTVTTGKKQIVTMTTKCLIFPDAKYFEIPAESTSETTGLYTLKDLAYKFNVYNLGGGYGYQYSNWIRVNSDYKETAISDNFAVGDKISISGSPYSKNNGTFIVTKLYTNGNTGNVLGFYLSDKDGKSPDFQYDSKVKSVVITKGMPTLDYVCESENRLWGCSNDSNTIYCSALGDPTAFFNYTDSAESPFAVGVASSENFTGCTKLGQSVLFFKEKCIHKVLGSYPAEYQVYTYNVDGLLRNCEGSLQVINDTLFYMGTKGINMYSGGTPTLISYNFGNKRFSNGIAGSDGDSYFICCDAGNNNYYLFNYDLNLKIWTLEDKKQFKGFARVKDTMYMLDSNGDIYYEGESYDSPAYTSSDKDSMEWVAQFKPFYETFEGRKIYSKMHLRVEIPKGSVLNMDVRYDNGRWQNVAKIAGKTTDVIPVPVPIARCDKFEIKLYGKGQFTVYSIDRHYTVRSDY